MVRLVLVAIWLGAAMVPPVLAATARSNRKGPSGAGKAAEKSAGAKSSAAKKNEPAEEEADAPEAKAKAKPEENAAQPARKAPKERAPNGTLETGDLAEFAELPAATQRLIAAALALTKLNLTYAYGSAEPSRGGMDCSGTIYYLLRTQGLAAIPRDSAGQYVWVRKAGGFQAVVGKTADSFEFDDLRPGDLLFWTGTYSVEREFPITHVMLYLGHEKKTKQRVMFGASDGRSFHGVQRWGVSVFDFKMPKPGTLAASSPDFVGYGPIPGLRASKGPAQAEEKETRENSPAAGTKATEDKEASAKAAPPKTAAKPQSETAKAKSGAGKGRAGSKKSRSNR